MTIQNDRLKFHVERLERLMGEAMELRDTIRDALAEAKGEGFDVKALRQVIRERHAKPAAVKAQLSFEFVLDTYRAALEQVTRDGFTVERA